MKKAFFFMFLALISIFAVSATSLAQKTKRKTKPQTEVLMAPPKTYSTCQPVKEKAVITIAENGDLSLGGKKVEKANLTKELVNYICDKLPFDQMIYIKAGAETPFTQVAEVVKLGRELDVDDVVLMSDIAGNAIVTGNLKVPAEEEKPSNRKEKANPLALIVSLQSNDKLELNGKTETLEPLIGKLAQTFETRRQKKIFMMGSREAEKTGFIHAAATVKLGELLKIVKEIEKTGAFPIGLDVDNHYPKMIFR